MHPILFESSWIIVPSWHLMFLLASLSTYFYAQSLRFRFNSELSPDVISNVFLIGYSAAYIGARSLSIVLEQSPQNFGDFLLKLTQLGPMTFYGGFLLSFTSCALYLKNKKRILSVMDLGIPALLLGISIGRLGCFLNGDDYGILASQLTGAQDPWWAVSFSNHSPSLPRVPVQLLESFFCLAFVLLTFLFQKKRPKPPLGKVGFLGIGLYSVARFFLEFLRGDERGHLFIESLSTSQTISLLLLSLLALFSLSPARK